MTNRWKVYKEILPWGQPDGQWLAVPGDDYYGQAKWFHTQQSALKYANRRARMSADTKRLDPEGSLAAARKVFRRELEYLERNYSPNAFIVHHVMKGES